MRHQKNTKKFKRTTEERKKLWQDLVSGLILHGKIVTFTTRAKWSARKFERLVTLCKRAGENRKLAYTKVRPFLKEPVARKLIEEIVPKLTTRNGGYTQIYKLHNYFTTHDKSIVMIVS
jgi:ribosomal protein L17